MNEREREVEEKEWRGGVVGCEQKYRSGSSC